MKKIVGTSFSGTIYGCFEGITSNEDKKWCDSQNGVYINKDGQKSIAYCCNSDNCNSAISSFRFNKILFFISILFFSCVF